ncbi:ABC transporter ATP-binding protein [Lottiidibacillus patelloidae]|uniref:ABC transporter ATP-binding protein n=1 Tax=Lottiidibacillus patelloidae TaxID=2670334 RepID=A0A263BTF2_9BACI|nr:ABC transporter ATP-binding protein [Lottiidibacillus patelloidae]OZM56979.1 ABC transporter ATP-binding protein [Lottiidibacillus patelloidae]
MLKVLSFLKPYKIHVSVALFFMLTELAVELSQPLLMAKIIDDGIVQRDMNTVIVWGSVMVGISLIAFASGIINSFYAAHVSQGLGYDLRVRLYEKIQSFAFANFNTYPTSSLITRMTNDVMQIQQTMFMSLRIMMRAPLLIIGGLVMALLVNSKLAISILISVPLLFFFLIWVLRKGSKLYTSVQKRLDKVNSVMRENLFAIRLIKALVTRKHEGKRFNRANEDLKEKTVRALRLMEATTPILMVVMNFSIIVILWFGNFGVTNGSIQVGEVVAIINYTTRITAAMSIFSWIIMAFSRAKASSARIVEVIDEEVHLVDKKYANDKWQVRHGKVEFRNVTFQYPQADSAAIEKLSFVAEPLHTVAILGATGSGKTSLMQLIPRLYDVNSGAIFIDDTSIDRYKLKHLRSKVGVVPQEAMLFSGTIKENIAMGKEHATFEEIRAAAKSAQIHETIEKFPNGYETVLGQKGVNLSGGQKQRLSIARALVRKPKILLLDDSTSALDLKTEGKLLEAVKQYECTTIIVTQKISTAMEADTILLLEDGKLLTSGSHDVLIRNSELYQKIYASQFGEEELQRAQTTT